MFQQRLALVGTVLTAHSGPELTHSGLPVANRQKTAPRRPNVLVQDQETTGAIQPPQLAGEGSLEEDFR
jgi:hypothetical protein